MLLVVILAAGGCDRVFGLTRETTTSICGPYRAPEAVLFSPALVTGGVHDFSVDSTGQIGMATANVGGWRGPHAIKLDGGMWVQDPARDKPVLSSLDGGHIQADGKAVGWTDIPKSPSLFEYTFSTGPMMWGQSSERIENTLSVSAHVGNTIITPDGILRHLVEILIPDRAPFVNTLQIYEKFGGQAWALTPQGNLFNTSKTVINVSGAVLTMAHDRMIFTANIGDEKVEDALAYRIYAAQRTRDQYEPGGEVDIVGLDSNVGFSEPWIDDDCGTLYFRQNDTTWMTQAVQDE